jgi:GT2 family glycosyltransferase
MKKTAGSRPKASQGTAVSQRVEAQIDALSRQVAERDAEIGDLRQRLDMLQEQLTLREDRLEGALYEVMSAQAIAQHHNGAASNKLAYYQMLGRIRDTVHRLLPRSATIAVVSKGHEDLTRLYSREAWHFPQDRNGVYAGFYPSNGLSAIVQLEALRSRGAAYLLFPAMAFWWLERYPDFARHLERRYRQIAREEEVCMIFSLREPAPWFAFSELAAECSAQLGREPVILDCGTGADFAARFPECVVFQPAETGDRLPYLDRSVDIVAVPAGNREALREARRVATSAVVTVEPGQPAAIAWRPKSAAVELPTVSIVIPCHNGVTTTDACLRSLTETLPAGFRGEIMVVDDTSTDGTAECLGRWAKNDPRVRVLRNASNLGFLGTAARGAASAKGDYLLFLNNDTVLLPGWLPPLLRVFRDFPKAGAVGGKLVFPDGTLQEAGGMIFRDGSAAHFGRDDHELDAGIYNFVREADYCSAALLATPRALFEELGGFDKSYAPAYYEDTDYCFKVRAAGRRIYYQPESAAVHVEGASCGTDLTRGAKRHQVLNHTRFTKKWSKLIAKLPARPDHHDKGAWRALALRGAQEVAA